MNNETPNNLAGRMEREIRAKPEKKTDADKYVSALYVLNHDQGDFESEPAARAVERRANRRLSRLQAP
jgi:hypothetical protein